MNSSPNRSSQTPKSEAPEQGQLPEQEIQVASFGPEDSKEPETTTMLTIQLPEESSAANESRDVASATLHERSTANDILTLGRDHPITPPSEPKQYRAIGLVRGRYSPDPEQFTRGMLVTPDGTEIDAVLLGRVMSLLKNHLDLQEDHLWVVYPRTRQQDDSLHVQIMGVWEPETLKQNDADAEEEKTEEEPQDELQQFPEIQEGYFSVRGEVIYQSQEEEYAVIKIKQAPRKGDDKPKFFKLKLEGTLGDRPVNHFWDLHLQLQGRSLVIERGNDIGSLFVKSRKPFHKGKKRFPSKRNDSYRSYSKGKPGEATASYPKEKLPKPVKRQKISE